MDTTHILTNTNKHEIELHTNIYYAHSRSTRNLEKHVFTSFQNVKFEENKNNSVEEKFVKNDLVTSECHFLEYQQVVQFVCVFLVMCFHSISEILENKISVLM